MTGVTGPPWLAAIVGVVLLLGSAYAVFRAYRAWFTRTATDFAVETCHAFMGVAMAGMLVPALGIVTPGASTWAWIVVSALITAGFALSGALELRGGSGAGRTVGLRRMHHLPHLALSAAMVYMLVGAQAMPGSAAMAGMTASGGAGSGMAPVHAMMPWATLDLALAVFMIGYTVVLMDRLPSIAEYGGVGHPRAFGSTAEVPRLYAPRGAAGLGIVMSAGMAYMLVMMFA